MRPGNKRDKKKNVAVYVDLCLCSYFEYKQRRENDRHGQEAGTQLKQGHTIKACEHKCKI